jgi:hypothetical protein
MKRLLFVLPLLFGCQFTTQDGSQMGIRVNLGEVGIELYHEAKETSGEGSVILEVDQGVQTWLFDSDGDGEDDQSGPEPVE